MNVNFKEKSVKKVQKKGSEETEEMRKRDLELAAADPKQTLLFQQPRKKSRTLNFDNIS